MRINWSTAISVWWSYYWRHWVFMMIFWVLSIVLFVWLNADLFSQLGAQLKGVQQMASAATTLAHPPAPSTMPVLPSAPITMPMHPSAITPIPGRPVAAQPSMSPLVTQLLHAYSLFGLFWLGSVLFTFFSQVLCMKIAVPKNLRAIVADVNANRKLNQET